MAWFFDRANRRLHLRKAHDETADVILARLKKYLEDIDQPVSILCGFWDDQRDAISYQELRILVERGYLDEATLDEWRQDYTRLITEKMPEIWGDAIYAGSVSQPLMESIASVFVFDPMKTSVLNWVRTRATDLITACTDTQRAAISMLLEDRIRNDYSVEELANLIRPCIGLTKGQASAVRNFYDSLIATLTEQHPRTSPEKIQAKALDKAMKYAEKLHRQRAMTIAQTEMAFAYNFGTHEGIRQAQENQLLGKCVKRWCTSGDERVCKKCEALDGTEVGMEDQFFVVKAAEGPDGGLLPPIHPRCACAVEYIEVERPAEWSDEMEPGIVGQSGLYGQGWSVTTNTPLSPKEPRYGCADVTQEWLSKAAPNSHTIRDVAVFNQNGIRYEVDGANIRLDYSIHEKKIAELLESRFGGELLMMPKVSGHFKNVKTPDYLFRGERYDLKDLASDKPEGIYNAIHKKRLQADNFIIDFSGSGLSEQDVVEQIQVIFTKKPYAAFVKRIILTDGKSLLRVFERQ